MATDAQVTHPHHEDGKAMVFYVWGTLLFLTVVEILLSYNQVFTPGKMLSVLLVLSLVKAALIILFFMHLKYEVMVMRRVLMSALVVCLTLMCVFFADAFRVVSLGNK